MIEEEYSLLNSHANNWKKANLTMQSLINDSKKLLTEYIKLIDESSSRDKEFIAKILDNDPDAMKNLSAKINTYFNQLIQSQDEFLKSKSNNQRQINDLSVNVNKVDDLLERYKLASLLFKNLFEALKQELEGRSNPWVDWMSENNSDSFTEAKDHWAKKKKNLVENLLPRIIEKVDDSYVNVYLRTVDPVWKN